MEIVLECFVLLESLDMSVEIKFVWWACCVSLVRCQIPTLTGRRPSSINDLDPLPGSPADVVFEAHVVDEDVVSQIQTDDVYPVNIQNLELNVSDIDIDSLLNQAEVTRNNNFLPCAKIESVKVDFVAGSFDINLAIRTGGVYVDGCRGTVNVSFLPAPAIDCSPSNLGNINCRQAEELRSGAGEFCMSKMGIQLDVTEKFAFETQFRCLEIGTPDNYDIFKDFTTLNSIDLNYDFNIPVMENKLERMFIKHRGDLHADTVPFGGVSFYANSKRAGPTPITDVDSDGILDQLPEDLENPDCFEFGAPGRFAYDPPRFFSEDPRILGSRLYAARRNNMATMGSFLHNFDRELDLFSIGVDGKVTPEQEFDMKWGRDPPTSPFFSTASGDFFTKLLQLQIQAQLSANIFFVPDAWNDQLYYLDQGLNRRVARGKTPKNSIEDFGCGISIQQMLESVLELDGVRDVINVKNLSNIPEIVNATGLSHQEVINLEKQAGRLIRKFQKFLRANEVTFPAFVSIITRTRGDSIDILSRRSQSQFDYSCGISNSAASPDKALGVNGWKRLFAINPDLNIHPSLIDILHDLSTTWEPVICSPPEDPSDVEDIFRNNEGRYGCLAVHQINCRTDRSIKRRVVSNLQMQEPACRLWKPVERQTNEAYINGMVSSKKTGVTFVYENVKIKSRVAEVPGTTLIQDSNLLNGFFNQDHPQSPETILSSSLLTTRDSLGHSNQLQKDLAEEVVYLQCGVVHEDNQRRDENPTVNPYMERCDPGAFFPESPQYRGCTPLMLTSQRNFIPIPKVLVLNNVLGSDCGSMNFNTGEGGGSHLRELMEIANVSGNLLSHLGRQEGFGANNADLQTFIGSPELCSSGQSCFKPSPSSLVKEWEKWDDIIEGVVVANRQLQTQEFDDVENDGEDRECFFGEHGGSSNSLFLPTQIEQTNFAGLTRSPYQPYDFVNSGRINEGRYPSFASKYYDSYGDISDTQSLALNIHALTKDKGFCGTKGSLGIPQSLEPIMTNDLNRIYHPVAWVHTPQYLSVNDPTQQQPLSETMLKTNLRHRLHGSSLPLTPLESLSVSPVHLPVPSPTPLSTPTTVPLPTPTPTPTPNAAFSPTPIPTNGGFPSFSNRPPVVMYEDRQLTQNTFMRMEASFTTKITFPLPRRLQEVSLQSLGSCVVSYPAQVGLELYGSFTDPTLVPLLGRVVVNLTQSSLASILGTTFVKMFLRVVCIPVTRNGVCWTPDVVETFFVDSCSKQTEVYPLEFYKIDPGLLQSILGSTEANHDSSSSFTDAFVNTALKYGRIIEISWLQPKNQVSYYDFGIFWKVSTALNLHDTNPSSRTFPPRGGGGSPLYLTYLGAGKKDVLIARDIPIQALDEPRVVRFLKRTERIPDTTKLCNPDYENLCGAGVPWFSFTGVSNLSLPFTVYSAGSGQFNSATPPTPTPTPTTFIPPSFTLFPSPVPSPSPFTRIIDTNNTDDFSCSANDLGCHAKDGTLLNSPLFVVLISVGGGLFLILTAFMIYQCYQNHRVRSPNVTKTKKEKMQ